jgi:lipoprotein NlpI
MLRSARLPLWLLLLISCSLSAFAQENNRVTQLMASAEKALEAGENATALRLTNSALSITPQNAELLAFRGRVLAASNDYAGAIADADKVVEMAPKWVSAYDARGSFRFMAGDFAGSVEDFNKSIELRPKVAAEHWQRGISLYYAGQYEAGRDQFAAYQTLDGSDVENAVWHYLCNIKLVGKDQAKQEIPATKLDRRVPLMKVYALFKGEGTVEEVIRAAQEAGRNEEESRTRNFYANLYLGLYYVTEEQPEKALEHLKAASIPAHEKSGYMWHVARIHAGLLEKEAAGEPAAKP